MDSFKAKQLLTRIQALLDQNGSSRLEKDLLKSYTIQLYEALTEDEKPLFEEITFKNSEIPVPEFKPQVEETIIHSIAVKKEEPIEEEPVFIRLPDPPKPKSNWQDNIATPEPVPVPVVEEPVMRIVEEYVPVRERADYVEPAPIEAEATPQPIPEPVAWSAPPPIYESVPDALLALFDPPTHSNQAVGNVQIQDIGESMGLNDRIFTLKDLFGGDKQMFDSTIQTLNEFSSFTEAKAHLLHGVAKRLNWADPERVKMAQEFIRIVRRRYPQNS